MSGSPRGAWAILVAAGVAGAGCVPAPAPLPAEPPLRLLVRSPIETLDPQLTNDFTTSGLLEAIYEPLIAVDDGLRPVPALAQSWRTPSNEWWRFEMRDGVRFHDGRPLRAADVAAAIQGGLTRSGSREGWKLSRVQSVEASERHVDIVTRGPAPLLLAGLSQALVAAGVPGDAASAIGTGPYRVAAWDRTSLTLRAFDGHRGPRPDFEVVEVRAVPDARARVDAVLAGRADLAEFPLAEDLARAAASPAARVVAQPGLTLAMLGLRATAGPLADPAVREALASLIDREALVREAVPGLGRAAFHLAPRAAVGFFEPQRVPPHSPASGAATLRRRWPPGHHERLFHVDRDRRVAEHLRRAFAAAGVRVEAVELPWPELDRTLDQLEAPLWLMQFTYTSGDVADLLGDAIHTRTADGRHGLVNFSGFSDPALDRVIEAAASEMEHGLRLERLREAVARTLEANVLLPLFEADTVYVTSRRVELPADPGGRLRPHRIRRAPAIPR
jgi:peptide/nickel transport system substrate-binding protein